jgi:hypothetical protein
MQPDERTAGLRLFGRLLVIWGVALPLALFPMTQTPAPGPGADPLAPWLGRLLDVGGGFLPFHVVLSGSVIVVALGLSFRACAEP